MSVGHPPGQDWRPTMIHVGMMNILAIAYRRPDNVNFLSSLVKIVNGGLECQRRSPNDRTSRSVQPPGG